MCVFQVIGGLVSSIGNIANTVDQSNAAGKNARRAQMASARAYRDGEQQAFAYNLDAGQRHSAQVAAAGGSGLSVTSGSFQDVMRGSRQASALDLAMTRANAGRAASQYLDQAADYKQQKESLERTAIFQAIGGGLGAAGNAVSSVQSFNEWTKKDAPNTRQTDTATISTSTANRPMMANQSASNWSSFDWSSWEGNGGVKLSPSRHYNQVFDAYGERLRKAGLG